MGEGHTPEGLGARRAEGQGESSEITGQREKELSRIRSEAYRRQEEILGESEALAVAAVYERARRALV